MDNRIDETNARCMEYALKHSLLARSKLAIILKNSTTGETEYCCVQCSAKYNEKEQMEQHLCMHNKQYKFLCGICGTGLKRKEHLDRHLLEHGELRPHKCPDCGKAFKRKEHLTIHKTIHNEKDQACTLCDRSFHRKDHLQKHLQTHGKLFLEQNLFPLDDQEALEMAGEEFHIKEEAAEQYDVDASYEDCEMGSSDPLDCEYADDVKPSADVRTPDAHVARPHMCPVCFKSYKRRDHLKIHSWTHMKKDKICSGCGKGFHKETQLSAHMSCCVQVHMRLRADQLGDSSLQDTSDGGDLDIMADNSLLVESRRLRVDPESRPHECPVCLRRFKRKQHLKVHSNVHLKQEASIWCSLCNEGFVANKQFEQHQCRADPAPPTPEAKKENKYPTELLVQEMVEESPTSPSYVMVQDEQNIPVPQRVFVCRFCQKPFKRRDHYKIHLHIHTGVKDFFCPDCGKGFYRKDHLQKHSQTHSKPKPKPKKQLPGLYPISVMQNKAAHEVKPEITITAPSNTKLRVPLQIKVPYQVVLSGADGRARAVTVDPHSAQQHEIFT